MAGIPAPVNQTVELADSALHGIFYEVVLNAVRAEALSVAPWLGLPVVNMAFNFILGKIADLIYRQLERYVSFSIIDTQVTAEKKAYQDAVDAYKAALETKDPHAISQALATLKLAAAALIHLDGSQ